MGALPLRFVNSIQCRKPLPLQQHLQSCQKPNKITRIRMSSATPIFPRFRSNKALPCACPKRVYDQWFCCLHHSDERDQYHHGFNFILQQSNQSPHIAPQPSPFQSVNFPLQQAMKFIEDICESIVSPPKLKYSPYDLGTPVSTHGRRHDFTLLNLKGHKMQASFYRPSRSPDASICVLYLHSMNGSRLQSTLYAEFVLKMGFSFCNFDFAGCGNSEGSSISFGANEKHDVLAVVDHLTEKFKVQKVILWGRSMGAASALKYCELVQHYRCNDYKNEVLGVVLDSCFRSFEELAVEIGNKHSELPSFMIKMGYYLIKGSLEEKGAFKVEELELGEVMGKLTVPTLLLTSPEDVTVSSEHSVALFDRCTHSRKKLAYIKGLHNQARDDNYLKEVRAFIEDLVKQYKNRSFPSLGQLSKFQRIASERRNFNVQGNEWQDGECYCSLFPSPRDSQAMPTTRRKQSQPSVIIQKVKVRSQANKYNFRSTQKVPPVAQFQLV